MARPSLESADTFGAIGYWHAREGRWTQAADRFTQRDPEAIAASRAQAVAAIDLFQDATFEWRKTRTVLPSSGRLLRRKSL